MPNLEEKSRFGIPDGWKEKVIEEPAGAGKIEHTVPTPSEPSSVCNPFLRCPFPGGSTVDSLRQFNIPGIYRRRFFPSKQGSD